MLCKLLQLNIEKGKLIDDIITFINNSDYDFLTLQEVAGGGFTHDDFSCFDLILKRCQNYDGRLVKTNILTSGEESYFGNAIFFNKDIKFLKEEDIWMNNRQIITVDDLDTRDGRIHAGYCCKVMHFDINGERLSVLSGHFTWGPRPYDTELTISRANIVKDFIAKLQNPFILAGDFNVEINTQTEMQFEEHGVNLTRKHNITNTLNPHIHVAKHLFPKGISCDFVFIPKSIKEIDFFRVDDNLSDHYGLHLDFYV